MFRLIKISFFIFLLFIITTGNSQSERPKIGLVLSGGGAKGIAHIRVLQVMDSLGIVPDYIAGTSMGAVVGALYASGYSANQIDSIARRIPWTSLFSNTITFPEINIEEKDEFGRYVYELPLKKLAPQFPLGIVEGQQIEELLAALFFPVNTISDFDQLPTPFLCVASDIVKGEPVILNSGSLAAAVRASMSIPTVFAPIRLGEQLMVDGGVFMNLPVSYCKEMGADFIIAVDVGGGLLKEEELTSALTLLLQTTFLAGNMSYAVEKEKSDIFIDVVKHLQYSTMDFEQGESMMKSGDLAVKEAMTQLVSLAETLKQYPKRKVTRISGKPGKYALEKIELEGISEANKRLVSTKFSWRVGDVINREQASYGVHRLLGTRLFDKITYTIEGDSVQSVLSINGKEKPDNAVKFALHYDTERGAGIILNFTKRNLVLPASRLVATIDLAENPRTRFNYFYYIGKQMRWWNFNEVYSERVILNSFIEGTAIPDLVNNHISLSSMFNQTIDERSYWGLGIYWQSSQLKPKVDPRDEATPEPLEVIRYNFNSLAFKMHYQINSLNKVFFPTKGTLLQAEGRLNFENPFIADLLVSTDTTIMVPTSGRVEPYARLNVRALRNIPLGKNRTLQLMGQIGLTQEISDQSDRFSAYTLGAGDFLSVGGQLSRPRSNNFVFTGLREGEVAVPQVITAGMQLQWGLSKNVYLIPAVNILAAGFDPADYWTTLFDFNFGDRATAQAFYQLGYGLTASYMSLLGPINMSVVNSPQVEKVRFFLSIGFNL
jgi:NTE family protein